MSDACVLRRASCANTFSKVSHWALSSWRRIKELRGKLEDWKQGILLDAYKIGATFCGLEIRRRYVEND